MNNWTEELLELMASKLAERKQREIDAVNSAQNRPPDSRAVSEKEFLRHAGNLVKVVKQDGN